MRSLHGLTDAELLALTPQEPKAFDLFYVRHERLVLAYLRRRTPSADVAVDLTAETFVAALAPARRFKPGREPAVAGLLGIARHKLLNPKKDFWRARINVKGATDVHILENIIAPGGTFGWHSHPAPAWWSSRPAP